MKANRWMVSALVTAGAFVATRGCSEGCSSSPGVPPDVKLALEFGRLCTIAKDSLETPTEGLRTMGAFLAGHAGDMMKDFGDTIAIIESTSDDEEHDARARLARDTLLAPLDACQDTWNEFGEAVLKSPEAFFTLIEALGRLERTIAIIFPNGSGYTFRELPAQLSRALDATVR